MSIDEIDVEAAPIARRQRAIPGGIEKASKDVLDARLVAVNQLRPAPWNPRTIESTRFKNLMASMQVDPDFLRLRPILAQGNGEIYAGNQRYRAAMQLGYEAVWAVVQNVSDKLARERAIRDNNEWGDWNEDLLSGMLKDLEELGTDLDLLGFEKKELDALMKGNDLPEPGEQETQEAPKMWGVIITCSSEEEQVSLLQRLSEEGRQVRALMS